PLTSSPRSHQKEDSMACYPPPLPPHSWRVNLAGTTASAVLLLCAEFQACVTRLVAQQLAVPSITVVGSLGGQRCSEPPRIMISVSSVVAHSLICISHRIRTSGLSYQLCPPRIFIHDSICNTTNSPSVLLST